MNRHVKKMEAARRLAAKIHAQTEKVGDLEAARESERREALRRPRNDRRNPTDAEMLANGCHPDSLNWDGADKGL